VVRKGDTLWDIAGKFLKKPWLWPEIWQANPQVANPHLIYPGDVLSLAYLDRTGTVVKPTPGPREAPIDAIPLSEVEPFLKDLRVVDEFQSLPYVVGIEDNQLRGSGGNLVYVKGLADATPASATKCCARPCATAARTGIRTWIPAARSCMPWAATGRTMPQPSRAASSSATNWPASASAR
jgi:hypothetical protein